MEKRTFADLEVVIENPKGSTRHWHDRDGRVSGSTEMRHDYGFLDGHVGSDGEEVDCYLGPDETAPMVFVIHQLKAPDFKAHDEDKVFLGFADEAAAKAAFVAHRNDGERAYGGMTSMSIERFKQKLRRRTGDGKIRHEVTPMVTQPKHGRLMAFDSLRGADGAVRAHVWDYVCVEGHDEKEGQATDFNIATLSEMVDNFVGRGDQIPIDWNHQSNYASKNGQPAPALGFYGALAVVWDGKIVKTGQARGVDGQISSEGLDLSKNGLWAYRCEVTELGNQLLPNFKYVSPMFTPEGTERDGTPVGYSLVAVAATNTPWQGGTAISFENGDGVSMAAKKSFGPLPDGIEVHWLPVNQAYLVTWKGQRVAGPFSENDLRDWLLRFKDWKPGSGMAISFEQERINMATWTEDHRGEGIRIGDIVRTTNGADIGKVTDVSGTAVTYVSDNSHKAVTENGRKLMRMDNTRAAVSMANTEITCAVCGQKFSDSYTAGKHVFTAHPGKNPDDVLSGLPPKSRMDNGGASVAMANVDVEYRGYIIQKGQLGEYLVGKGGRWFQVCRTEQEARKLIDDLSSGAKKVGPRGYVEDESSSDGVTMAVSMFRSNSAVRYNGKLYWVVESHREGDPSVLIIGPLDIRPNKREMRNVPVSQVTKASDADGEAAERIGSGKGSTGYYENMDNSGRAAASHKGAGRMSKLAGVARILKMEGDPPDADVKKALEAKMDSDAVAAMEEEAYDHNGAADSLEQLARAYEDSNYEEEGDETPPHVVMRKMAAKFRRLGKMGDPPFGGKETPSEEAAEGHAMAKHEDPEMAKHEKEEEESPKLAAMQATVTALGAKLAKFEAIEASREKAIRDERERGYEQLADQAVAGGYPKAKRGALINFARSDFEGARATVEHFLPKGTPIGLFDRVSKGGEPIGGPTTGRGRDMGTPAAPRRVQAMGRVFVEDDGEYASEIMSMAKSKDPIVMERLDQHLSEGERGMLYKRLLAARKVVSQERPDLAASE